MTSINLINVYVDIQTKNERAWKMPSCICSCQLCFKSEVCCGGCWKLRRLLEAATGCRACTDDEPLSSSDESLFSGFDSVLSRSSVGKSSRTSSVVAQKCNGSCAGCKFEAQMELKLQENSNVIGASLFDVSLNHVSDVVLSPQPIHFNMYETVFEMEEDDGELSSVNSELMVDKSTETIEI